MTPLERYYGLLDLMLREGDCGRRFDLNGVPCEIEELTGHGIFKVETPTFALVLAFPGWFIGDTSVRPVQIMVAGDLKACFRWLPIHPEDKRAIIARMPLTLEEQVLLMLLV